MQAQELSDEDLNADDLRPLLASLKFFKAKYTHNESAAGFCFDALSYLANFRVHFRNYVRKYIVGKRYPRTWTRDV